MENVFEKWVSSAVKH